MSKQKILKVLGSPFRIRFSLIDHQAEETQCLCTLVGAATPLCPRQRTVGNFKLLYV